MTIPHSASARVAAMLRAEYTFQISVDTGTLPQGLVVAEAALKAGVTLVEMGTPLLKCEGVLHVVPAFRRHFPDALLLADMKTMDGGAFEADSVFAGGGNIIDFLAISGVDTARAIVGVRDGYRQQNPDIPRLVFADILVPHQGPAVAAVEVAEQMLAAGVDGVGVHLQLDARRADPELFRSGYLADVVRAVHARVGDRASVQVVGGLTIAQAKGLAAAGLKAFVISGNLGFDDGVARYDRPAAEIEAGVRGFMEAVAG